MCTETAFVTTPGNLSKYQKFISIFLSFSKSWNFFSKLPPLKEMFSIMLITCTIVASSTDSPSR
jgi:hypothetical protein